MASCANSKSLCPLMRIILVSGSSAQTSLLSASPSINGILISVIRMSGRSLRICGSANSPSGASPQNSKPYRSQSMQSRSPSRTTHSSSTRKTFSNAITSESLYHSFPAFKRIISRFAAGVFKNQSCNHPDEHIRCFLTTFLCSLLTAVVRTGIIKTYT